MNDELNTDKRKSTRVDFSTEITLKTPSQQHYFEGNSKDISQKGVFIYTDKDIPVDTLWDMILILRGASPEVTLNITGKVVRKTDEGIGIEFVEMDLESYTHLKNIVKYNKKEN